MTRSHKREKEHDNDNESTMVENNDAVMKEKLH